MFQKDPRFWLIGCAVIAVSLLAIRLLLWGSGGRWQPARLARLHRDEVGSVQSLSFVLTLPIFIMIMMGIVQASQVMLAKIVVEYSAIAAARSASVWVPAHLADFADEGRNRIGTLVFDEQLPEGLQYEITGDETPKIARIRLAAAQACMPIAPSRDTDFELESMGISTIDSILKAYQAMVPNEPNPGAIDRRLRNKLAYSLANTAVSIVVFHPPVEIEPPLQEIYEHPDQYDPAYLVDWRAGPTPESPPIPIYHENFELDAASYQLNEIGWQDVVTVTVYHDLALLPGPGRMLSRYIQPPSGATDEISETIQRRDDIYTWPLTATASASIEGQKSIIRYEHYYSGEPLPHAEQ